MMKTLGFGMGAMVGPALLTGAILYAFSPDAEAPVDDVFASSAVEQDDTPKAYKDYGVVWTKL